MFLSFARNSAMHSNLRRQIISAAAILAAVAAFGLARGEPFLQGACATVAYAIVIHTIARSDEVERLLALRAASATFGLTLLVATLVAVFGPFPDAEFWLRHMWACMMATFVVSWGLLRIRLG